MTEVLRMTEVEVFRLCDFDKDSYYEHAIYTRREGTYPTERYFTTNVPQFVGKHVRGERWGFGDGSGGAEIFVDDSGKETRIVYTYEGTTGFRIATSS